MKAFTSLVLTITLGSVVSVSTRAEWKFVSLLRGDSQAPPAQRVAFVGSAVVKQSAPGAEKLVRIDEWKKLEAGETLQPGDLIRTHDAAVVLKMNESGSFIRVNNDTILRLVPCAPGWDRSVLTGCEEREGFVVRGCRGAAFFRQTNSSAWQPIRVDTVLPESAEIRTTQDSVLDLVCTASRRPMRVNGAKKLFLADLTSLNSAGSPSLAALGQ